MFCTARLLASLGHHALALLFLCPASVFGSPEQFRPKQTEGDLFAASLSVLDLFMQAGREEDVRQAAQWMQIYDAYPPKAINLSHTLIKRNREIFANYISVRDDVYGYEVKRNPLQTKVYIEGAVRTADGSFGEFAAELVYKFRRWRIQSLEIN